MYQVGFGNPRTHITFVCNIYISRSLKWWEILIFYDFKYLSRLLRNLLAAMSTGFIC